MHYTINGKDYTGFDINRTIAHILYNDSSVVRSIKGADMVNILGKGVAKRMVDYCNKPSDAWPIIEKCWDELMGHTMQVLKEVGYSTTFQGAKWQYLMQKHNCTKLIAACICFIEMNEAK